MTTTHPETPAPGGRARLAGREVARIGFGAMQLERAGDRDRAHAVLRAAVAAGVEHIDTAQFYGSANAWIAEALSPYPDDLLLATKVGAERDGDGALVAAQRPEQLRAQVHANLRSLRAERLAVVNLRRLDGPPGVVAAGDQLVDLDSQLAELGALRDAGLIDAIGLSAVAAHQLADALPAGIACVQNAYGVLDRATEPVLDLCCEHGIAWVPFFPLGSAFPDRPKATDDPTVREIAAQLGATPAQVALAWLLARYDNTLLIPGTADPAHLRDNLDVGEIEIPREATARLDALGA